MWPRELLVPELRAFDAALRKQHYAKSTIRDYLQEFKMFDCWLSRNSLALHEVNDSVVECYLDIESQKTRQRNIWQRRKASTAIHALLRHLKDTGVISQSIVENNVSTEADQWLNSYREHLERVVGLAPTICQKYLFFVSRLLGSMGQDGLIDWTKVTPDKIVEFVQSEAAVRRGSGPSDVATVVRSFLRFMTSQGKLSAGLKDAIPTVRRWPKQRYRNV